MHHHQAYWVKAEKGLLPSKFSRVLGCVARSAGMCALSTMLVPGCESRSHARDAPTEVAQSSTTQYSGSRQKQAATSLVQLIANPERFNESDVMLAGYLVMDRPGRKDIQGFLHLNKEDAQRMLGASVELSFSRCASRESIDPLIGSAEAVKHHERYVAIHGQFSSTPDSPTRPGMVCGITVLNDLPSLEEDKAKGAK